MLQSTLLISHTPFPLSQFLIHPLTLPARPAPLIQLRNRTSPLRLIRKFLKLRIILRIRLHMHIQLHIIPIRIPFLPLNQNRRIQIGFHRDLPVAQGNTEIFRDERAGHLRAGAETAQCVCEGSGRGIFAAKGRVGVYFDEVRAAFDFDALRNATALAVDAEGDFVQGARRLREGADVLWLWLCEGTECPCDEAVGCPRMGYHGGGGCGNLMVSGNEKCFSVRIYYADLARCPGALQPLKMKMKGCRKSD